MDIFTYTHELYVYGWAGHLVVWPRLDYIGVVCIFHIIGIVQHMNMFIKHVAKCAAYIRKIDVMYVL